MMLAATRRIPQTHADLAGGTWRGDYYRYDPVGPELEDSTVGLVGYGAIGSRVARMLAGFGAHVLVYDPYVAPEALAAGVEQVELDELLSRSRLRHPARPGDAGDHRDDRRGADRRYAARVGARELRARGAAGLRRGVRRPGLRPPVRRGVRRLPRGADPAGLAAAAHAAHRHDPAPGGREPGDGAARRRRSSPATSAGTCAARSSRTARTPRR